MNVRRLSLLCVASLAVPFTALPLTLQAQDPNGFQLTASYDRPGLPVPRWQLRIEPSGQVQYTSEHAPNAPAAPDNPVSFTLSPAAGTQLRKLLDESHGLQPCETKAKGLARMGMKTIQYQSGAQPAAQCTFNYTDNKPLAAAAEFLIDISFTIEQGAVLDHLHRYDRLGLDPVMTQLATAYKDGRAKEIGSIRPILQSLVSDDQVLERVRQKASALLATSPSN